MYKLNQPPPPHYILTLLTHHLKSSEGILMSIIIKSLRFCISSFASPWIMEWWSVSITTFSLQLQETTRQAAITAESHRFPLQPDVYPSISIAVVHTVSTHYNKLCISYIIRSYTSLITTSVFVLCPVFFFLPVIRLSYSLKSTATTTSSETRATHKLPCIHTGTRVGGRSSHLELKAKITG